MRAASPTVLLPLADLFEHDGMSGQARLVRSLADMDPVLYNPLVIQGPAGSGKTMVLAFVANQLPSDGRALTIDASVGRRELMRILKTKGHTQALHALLVDNRHRLGQGPAEAWREINTALDLAYPPHLPLPVVIMAGDFANPWTEPKVFLGTGRAMAFTLEKPSGQMWSRFVFHLAQALGLRIDTAVRELAAGRPLWPGELLQHLVQHAGPAARHGETTLRHWRSPGAEPLAERRHDAPPDPIAPIEPVELVPLAWESSSPPLAPAAAPPALDERLLEGIGDWFQGPKATPIEPTAPVAALPPPPPTSHDAAVDEPRTLPPHLHELDRHATLQSLVVGNVNDVFLPAAQRRLADDRFGSVIAVAGGEGVGKSVHLHALANQLVQQRRGLAVGVADGSDVGQALSHLANALDPEVDVLILDDLEPALADQRAQHHLGLILRTYRARGRRVLLGLPAAPQELPGLIPLLDAELRHGFVVTLTAPDLAMRRKLVEAFLQRTRCQFDKTGVDRLAERAAGSVRDLETTVFRVAAHATSQKRVVSAALLEDPATRQALANVPTPSVTPRRPQVAAAETTWPPPLDPDRMTWQWRHLTDVLAADIALGPLQPRLLPLQTQKHPTTGDLRGPDDIINLLQALGSRSGRLAIYSAPRLAELYVRDGQIVYAHIINRSDRLGDSLVLQGALAPRDLDEALREQRDTKQPLGIILRDLGYVAEDVLADAVRRQVEDAVHDVMVWKNAFYTFTEGVQVERVDRPVSISPVALALDIHKRRDEWKLIRAFVPDVNICYRMVSGAEAVLATLSPPPHMETIWPRLQGLLNGQRPVRQVYRELGLSEYTGGMVFVMLHRHNLLEAVGAIPNDPSDRLQRQVRELRTCAVALVHAGLLNYAKLACEQVLALAPTDAVARFYLAYLKARSGDLATAAQEFRQLATDPDVGPSAALNRAVTGAALADAERAVSWIEANRHQTLPTHWLLSAGYIAMHARRYAEAERFLKQYQQALGRTAPPAAFFFFLGTAYCAWGHDARAMGQDREATKHFTNARAALGMGVKANADTWETAGNYAALLIEQGDLSRAHQALEQAMAAAPQAPTLYTLRGDLAYRQRAWGTALQAYEAALTYRRASGSSRDSLSTLYERLAELAAQQGQQAAAQHYGLHAMRTSRDPLSTSIRLEGFGIELPALSGADHLA